MMTTYTIVEQVAAAVEPPADGTLSRVICNTSHVKALVFGFSAGQELSEHTASMPAIMHFLQGEADVLLGSDRVKAKEGTWIHMPASLPHSIHAKTPVTMLLLLLTSQAVSGEKQPLNPT